MATEHAIGIDIGGTGIKGAVVDLATGELVSERAQGAHARGRRARRHPRRDARNCSTSIDASVDGAKLPLGVCFPAVVKHGRTLSAANVSKEWIGLPAEELFEKALGREIHFINDADAAGYAESRYGAAEGADGPRDPHDARHRHRIGAPLRRRARAEHRARSPRDRRSRRREPRRVLGDGARATSTGRSGRKRLQRYYSTVEFLFSPDLFIVGGGVSKHHEQFLPLLEAEHPDRAGRAPQQRGHPRRRVARRPLSGAPHRSREVMRAGRLIRRVLSPGRLRDTGSTAISLGTTLPQPSSGLPGNGTGSPIVPCLALLRTRFTEPTASPRPLVGSYPTVSPLPPACAGGGLLSVALSRGLPRVGVTHRPALRSPDVPRRRPKLGDATVLPTRSRSQPTVGG